MESANGVHPSNMGNNWVYGYSITDGGSVSDTLPIQICVTAQNRTWNSFTLEFGPSGMGGNLTNTQVPKPTDVTFNFVDSDTLPDCQNRNISITTGPLVLTDPNVAETFSKLFNIGVKSNDPNPFTINLGQTSDNIHIFINVLPVGSNISCFITDSSGNFLTNCAGETVDESGSNDGRFAIVANSKKNVAVSTNPGQFYYNVLWKNNTGSSQTVAVSFERNGVNPKGAQAIHAWAFAPPFSGVTVDNFNAVNEGIPGGSDDQIENIVVPNGWTLWVSYHLEWSGLGGPANHIATGCGNASQQFAVTATVSGTGITSESCTAGALGYRK